MFKKITLNTLASFSGRILGGILALVSIGFITRSLGVGGFGEYSTVVAYLSTFQILADLGLYQLLTKEISQNPEREKELVGLFFTLRLVAAGVFLAISSLAVFLFPYSFAVKIGVVITASAFIFLSLSQMMMGVFQKYIKTYKSAIAEFIGRSVQLGLVALFFVAGVDNLFLYLGALIAGSFTIFLVSFIFGRRLVPFRLRINVPEWKRIIKTTLPIAVSLVFTLLYFKLDTVLLSVLKPEEDVGIYNAAYKVLETIIFFPAAFIGLILPFMSRYAKREKERLSELLSRLSDIMTISALPVAVGGILLSATIVFFIGGADFLIAQAPLRVLFVAIAVIFYGTLFGNAVIAMGLQKRAMWAYFAGFVFNVIANLIFIPKFTYMGAAWTTVATEFLVTVALIWIVRKRVRFLPSLKTNIKAVLTAALMGGVVYLFIPSFTEKLGILVFLGAVIAGGAVYVGAGYLAGFIRRSVLPPSF